ncbi:MAG: hypothetical protein IPK73_16660 [Candidatus Obscuribacter sp.]|nr:hypothetical protein [Candidatus Obscuribacter sp.]MBK9278739.1 hypothetical protein [Candidatus Obscuribacter sp.]MBL8084409.1 hypothetical protein [Candidatus Obscuribacter sp.]
MAPLRIEKYIYYLRIGDAILMIVLEILSTLMEFLTECHHDSDGSSSSTTHSGFCMPLLWTLFATYMGIVVYNFFT